MSDDEKPATADDDLGPRFGPVGGSSGNPEPYTPLLDKPPAAPTKPVKPKKPSLFPERDEWALPERYGVDTVVALVRGPWWVFIYWELADATRARAKALAGEGARMLLRVMSGVGDQILSESRVPDVAVHDWYAYVTGPGMLVRAVIGFQGRDGVFHSVFASEEKQLPSFVPGPVPKEVLAQGGQAAADAVEEIYDYAGGPELSDPARMGDELRDGGFGPFVWSKGGQLSGSGIGMGYRPRPDQPTQGKRPGPPSSPWGNSSGEGPEGGGRS